MGRDRCCRIGELARATGLTVRTLRHYEQIGLLAPTTRTEGSQRLYGSRAIRRLYRIRALRDLGLSLSEIAQTIHDDESTLGDLLRAHRARIDVELARLTHLRTLLDHACASVESGDDPDILATIEAMSLVSRHVTSRAPPARGFEDTWRTLGDALRAHMNAGEPPSAPAVQSLALAARDRIAAFAEDDRATLDALAHLRVHAPPKDLAGWDPPLMRYLDQALQRLTTLENEPCETK